MVIRPKPPPLVRRVVVDELSTGQGAALRRRAAAQLGGGQAPPPSERLGLSAQRLGGQVARAPKAAERARAAVAAALGASPLRAVQTLNGELVKLMRDLPARAAAFEACRPELLRALDASKRLRGPEQVALVAALDRVMMLVGRSQHDGIVDAASEALRPASAEVEALALRRPTPFLSALSREVRAGRGWLP